MKRSCHQTVHIFLYFERILNLIQVKIHKFGLSGVCDHMLIDSVFQPESSTSFSGTYLGGDRGKCYKHLLQLHGY